MKEKILRAKTISYAENWLPLHHRIFIHVVEILTGRLSLKRRYNTFQKLVDKDNSINRFFKKKSSKHFPATGEATLCGVIVDCCKQTGLAKNIENFIYGGELKDSY